MMPSNWDEEIRKLRDSLRVRLNYAADSILKEEINKLLGRIKIITSENLGTGEYYWDIEPEKPSKEVPRGAL